MARAPADSEIPASPRTPGTIRALPFSFADDAELVAACVAKRPAATRAIWDRYASLVRGLLRRTLGRSDVDDVVQDTFMRFFRLVPRLREPSKLKSFVIGITLRVAKEELRYRRVRRWLRLSSTGDVAEPMTPPSDGHAREALARLDALLDRIDDDSRLVFVLRFVENVSTTEIAEALDCSLATAKRRVKRARERVEAAAQEDPVLCDYVAAGGHDD